MELYAVRSGGSGESAVVIRSAVGAWTHRNGGPLETTAYGALGTGRQQHRQHNRQLQYLEPYSIGQLCHDRINQNNTMRMFWTNLCNRLATGDC